MMLIINEAGSNTGHQLHIERQYVSDAAHRPYKGCFYSFVNREFPLTFLDLAMLAPAPGGARIILWAAAC